MAFDVCEKGDRIFNMLVDVCEKRGTESLTWPLMFVKRVTKKSLTCSLMSVKRVTESLAWSLMSVKKSDIIPNIAFEKRRQNL